MASKEQSSFQVTDVEQIPKDWKNNQIEDVTLRVCVGFVGSCFEDYCDQTNGIPMIRTTNLSEDGLVFSDLKYVTKEFHLKNKKSQLAKGDIVVARHGDSGKACYYDADFESNCLNIIVIRPDKTKCIPKFLLYSFRSPQVRRQIEASIVGSVQGVLNTKIVAKIKLALPRIEEQKNISNVLSNLDSKIILNKKMNRTLEAIGQAVFKRWFVDFEFPDEEGKPYKSSGGEMKNSKLGDMPKDWKIGCIEDVADVIGGGTPSTKVAAYFSSKGVAWLTPKDLSGYEGKFIDKGSNDLSEEGLKNSSAKVMPKGTVLFTSRAPIGYIAVALNDVTTNQGFKSLVPKNNMKSEYLYHYIKKITPFILSISSGSTFGEVTGSTMKQIKMIIPKSEILQKFEDLMQPINARTINNLFCSRTLIEIRDSLLPKLMSGKIRVPVQKEGEGR